MSPFGPEDTRRLDAGALVAYLAGLTPGDVARYAHPSAEGYVYLRVITKQEYEEP